MAKLPNIIEREKSLLKTVLWALGLAYRANRRFFLLAIILTITISIVSFLNIISFSKIVTLLQNGAYDFEKIIPYIILLFFVEFLPPAISYIQTTFQSITTRELREITNEQLCQKLALLDIATIEQPEFQDLVAKADRGVHSTISLVDFSFNIIRDIVSFIVASIIILKVFPLGFLIILLFLAPAFIVEHITSKQLFKLWELQIKNNRSIANKLGYFKNKFALVELKVYQATQFIIRKIQQLRLMKNNETDNYSWRKMPYFIGVKFLSSAGTIIVLAVIIYRVFQGNTTLGELTLIWGTVSRYSGITEKIFRSVGRLVEHQAHALKLYSVFEMNSYIKNHNQGIIFDQNIDTIEFKNVSFEYPGANKKILDQLSFTISKNQEVALVGLNGAGKTTLLRLLTRVYDPTEGEIFLNNIPLRDYVLQSWQNNISVMNQDYRILVDETIKDNIVIDNKYNKESFDFVMNNSTVSHYINNFEKKSEQLIGKEYEGGVELSKGQNQKLILARTLYRDAPLIILDEPTAAIDALSEDTIFKNLREKYKDKTRIIISHKFSNVRDADKIILIEHGQIIEQGSHIELMNIPNGKYKELFELQAEGYK